MTVSGSVLYQCPFACILIHFFLELRLIIAVM